LAELLSLSLSEPREVEWKGRRVRTGIFKEPVRGRRLLTRTHFEGDGQADLENHGGIDKAAYVYSNDHYSTWARELDRESLPHGQFGENLTVTGLLEDEVHIGDVFRLGGARVVVTQPRVPCFKLGIRMGDASFPKRFLASLRSGFYLAVLEEGRVGTGDEVERIETGPGRVTVREIQHSLHFDRGNRATLERALAVPALSADWRRSLEELLD